MNGSGILYIAQANHRANLRPFGIKTADRRSHMYVIGKTGTGKSTLLRVMIEQDILAGNGTALLDPHGDLVEAIQKSVPSHRQDDLIYLDTPSNSRTWHFNPFSGIAPEDHALAAASLVEVFKKLWPKLLKSYALDAANDHDDVAHVVCTSSEACAFMWDATTGKVDKSEVKGGIATHCRSNSRLASFVASEDQPADASAAP